MGKNATIEIYEISFKINSWTNFLTEKRLQGNPPNYWLWRRMGNIAEKVQEQITLTDWKLWPEFENKINIIRMRKDVIEEKLEEMCHGWDKTLGNELSEIKANEETKWIYIYIVMNRHFGVNE